jgi:uncharacterized protein
MPGIARNARVAAELCPGEETAALVLAGSTLRVCNPKVET